MKTIRYLFSINLMILISQLIIFGQIKYYYTNNSGGACSAIGMYSEATGSISFSFGDHSEANYTECFAGGNHSIAGNYSVALGNYCTASGDVSVALGDVAAATGGRSYSMGRGTNASVYMSTALGTYNSMSGSSSSWVSTDPLFVIGNGASSGARSNALTILKNGRVGITTVIPKEKFQIGDRWTFHDGGSKVMGYNYYYDGGDKRILQDESSAIYLDAVGTISFRVAPSGSAGSSISWTEALTINNSGNVGVKTSSYGDAQLAVNGKILCIEIEVQEYPWSDYVFNKDYELMSLNNLENFIKTHHHLPNVPSGKKIEKEGLNLGEMDAIMLSKIEELTLYMIELKKENELLKTEIKKLKKTSVNINLAKQL